MVIAGFAPTANRNQLQRHLACDTWSCFDAARRIGRSGGCVASERLERRLAAVVAADVAGYERLMRLNDERTLTDLKNARRTLILPAVTAHRGRIGKTVSGEMLLEFPSAVEAAQCAVAVQRGMAARNIPVPEDERIEFRIGIHLGDVMIDENDIFGDGVNIAARLEKLAEPAGIRIPHGA